MMTTKNNEINNGGSRLQRVPQTIVHQCQQEWKH